MICLRRTDGCFESVPCHCGGDDWAKHNDGGSKAEAIKAARKVPRNSIWFAQSERRVRVDPFSDLDFRESITEFRPVRAISCGFGIACGRPDSRLVESD